jgi:transposase
MGRLKIWEEILLLRQGFQEVSRDTIGQAFFGCPIVSGHSCRPRRCHQVPTLFGTGSLCGLPPRCHRHVYNGSAHAQSKFIEAITVLPTKERKKGGSSAHEGLAFCDKRFRIERDLHDVSAEERFAGRQARSKPVLERFAAWLEEKAGKVLPKSALGGAITYCRNQWPKLLGFLKDGRLELDNNRSERSIKPFVIGRKNWLFANSPRGARSSAIIYRIVETAKENGLNPFSYLTYLFEQLPNVKVKDPTALDLLPWSEAVQQKCRVPAKPSR